jgi:hypothetical protein
MKDLSNINALHSQVIFLQMREKSTEELISIWVENDRKAWSQEEFNAVQSVLSERLGKLPAQKTVPEIKANPVKIKKTANDNRLGEPFFNLSPINNARAVIVIFAAIILCLGSIVVRMVEQNTKIFWDFAQTSIPSQIEKIEIQRIDQNGNGIGNVITIDDKEKISEFVSILKTIQEYQEYHHSRNYEVRIKIFRIKKLAFGIRHSTIELECYTISGEGNTLFVSAIWVEPGMYSYGNGNAKFLAPDLIDWLNENGIPIQ